MAEQAINTEISLDDADLDFELRDEDFLGRATERAPEPESMEVEVVSANATNGEKSAETIRKNAIYVSGVDDLSTEDMMGYGRKYISDFPFKIEWINDTSCMRTKEAMSHNISDTTLTSKPGVFLPRRSNRGHYWHYVGSRVL